MQFYEIGDIVGVLEKPIDLDVAAETDADAGFCYDPDASRTMRHKRVMLLDEMTMKFERSVSHMEAPDEVSASDESSEELEEEDIDDRDMDPE
jgi:hypothetical protein